MGVFCEINLLKIEDECFRPGDDVSGTIKYSIDEDNAFDNIIITLKGNGKLSIRTKNRKHNTTYKNSEEYVDIDHVIYTNEEKAPLSRGSYETQFSFTLPPNIPSSLKYRNSSVSYNITCKIKYYIRIKFVKPGFLQFDTKFKKIIRVLSGISPRLPTVPTVCEQLKTLTILSQLFSSKKSVVDMKATIQNCIIQSGGTIDINYDILNNTNLVIKGVETKLKQIYSFTSKGGYNVKEKSYIPSTDTKTGSIKSKDIQNMDVSIDIPIDITTLDHSRMVSRQYCVVIQVILPLPHRNAVLKIPVQIDARGMITVSTNTSPPSYWEALGEKTKNKYNENIDDHEDYEFSFEDDEYKNGEYEKCEKFL